MTKGWKKVRLLAGAFVFAMAVAGCGDSGESTESSDGPHLSPEPAPSKYSAEQLSRLEELRAAHEASEGLREREKAHWALVEFFQEMEDYPEVIASSEEFLGHEKYRFWRTHVEFAMAQAQDKEGNAENALAAYERVLALNPGMIECSAPAVRRSAELRWERNQPAEGDTPSDRQTAFQALQRYLQMTSHLHSHFKPEEMASWKAAEKLAKDYAASGEVVPVKAP